MVEGIIFDCDGVLVDSEDLSIEVGKEYFKTIGINAEKKDFEKHLGCGEYEFFVGTAKDLGVDNFSYEEASKFFKSYFPELVKKVDITLPGAREFIEKAKSAGIPLAVASSAPKWKVFYSLQAVGMKEEDFVAIITGEDIYRNKPNGDIYTLASIRLKKNPEDCVVFEDTVGGIKAGLNAGCKVISLTTTIDSETAFSAGADGVISDLSAIETVESKEVFSSFIDAITAISPDAVVYGANYIIPEKHDMSYEVLKKAAISDAWDAWENAYTPYSHFKVGAALVSAATGRIYSGCNVENSSYGGTICAERNAIFSAVAKEGAIGIDLLVVVSDDDPPAPPCALCRQVISEFARPETKIVLVSKKGTELEYTFSEIMPFPFIMPAMRK